MVVNDVPRYLRTRLLQASSSSLPALASSAREERPNASAVPLGFSFGGLPAGAMAGGGAPSSGRDAPVGGPPSSSHAGGREREGHHSYRGHRHTQGDTEPESRQGGLGGRSKAGAQSSGPEHHEGDGKGGRARDRDRDRDAAEDRGGGKTAPHFSRDRGKMVY